MADLRDDGLELPARRGRNFVEDVYVHLDPLPVQDAQQRLRKLLAQCQVGQGRGVDDADAVVS
jgi:hypothetical protein